MSNDYELPKMPKHQETQEQIQPGRPDSFDRDEADLMRLGKKPVLKVSSHTHSI